ncbi:hypothetical protein NHH03_21610 [Stieleria sp. TO1_6]|uniref:hypothetical protein n=1 Tax=Stieleria tagensis TaxID=2956795 RepID=UPI00209B8AA0|nr:hypothetical protein [Stieleria tagensis]MCO8124351.1 hypothetical protein [Stieleria tagensis]
MVAISTDTASTFSFDAPASLDGEQEADAGTNASNTRLAKNWLTQVVQESIGRGNDICHAYGLSAEDLSEKRKFHMPNTGTDGKPKAKINNFERGAGQCDATGNKWGDWVAFVAAVDQTSQGDAARRVAEIIRFDLPKSQPRGKSTRKPSLKLMPWNPVYAGQYLAHLEFDRTKHERLRDAGLRIAKYQGHAVIAFPVWGPRGSKADPVNWVVVRTDGGLLRLKNGETTSKKTIGGGARGIIGDVRTIDAMLAGQGQPDLSVKTEGVTDWLAAFLRDDVPDSTFFWTNPFGCADGVSTFRKERWSIDLFANRDIWVIHDADRAGQDSAIVWCECFTKAGARAKNVTLPFEVKHSSGDDLRDFFKCHDWDSMVEKSHACETLQLKIDSRPAIEWSDNEKDLVDSTIEALTGCEDIFQRGGELLDVTEARHPLNPDALTLRVRRLPHAHLRTLITSCARFITINDDGEARPKKLPDSFTRQVDAYGSYPGIRELESVSEYPFMREDGSICTANGYDPATRTYLKTNVSVTVAESPTIHDATQATNRILDLVADFEFKKTHHKSAWLAGLLTVFCKPAIRGCVPLFLFEASVQAAGKTRLVDGISTIATGKSLARNPWPSKDEEVSKSITAIVLSGIPLVLFDNCKTQIGGQAIEALGTAEVWKSRILGQSKESGEVPIRQVYFLTGNNCSVSQDIARRTCFVRLEPTIENPDLRSDFRIPNLLDHILENRETLICDALTILRAFKASGESPDLEPWGGFENWSALVRGAVVWLGLADPIKGTKETKASAQSSDIFGDLIAALESAGASGKLSREIYDLATKRDPYGVLFHPELNDVFLSDCDNKKITTQRIGKILQRYDGRILNGKKFFSEMLSHQKVKKWFIEKV